MDHVQAVPNEMRRLSTEKVSVFQHTGRRALVKLPISNHRLMIEIGRYNQTTKDNRHCPFCGCNVIEDEVNFLFSMSYILYD